MCAGCINDAKCLKYLLINQLGFKEQDIRILTDDQAPGFWPTRRNIWEQIQWLVQGTQPGDSLFFSFSGERGWGVNVGWPHYASGSLKYASCSSSEFPHKQRQWLTIWPSAGL